MEKLVKRLNAFVKNRISEVEFLTGDYNKIYSMVKETVPFRKVALFCTRDEYDFFGKTISNELSKNGNAVCAVILEKKKIYSINDMMRLSTLPEDLSISIVLNPFLRAPALYFSTIRNIEVIMGVNSSNFENMLDKTVLIDNNGIDTFSLNVKRKIVFIGDIFDKSVLYASAISKLIDIIDYRLNCASRKLPVSEYLDEYSNYLQEIYTVYKTEYPKQQNLLIENYVKMLLVNYTAEMFDGKEKAYFDLSTYGQLEDCFNQLKLFNLAVDDKYAHILEVPDYSESVDKASEITKSERKSLVNNLNYQNYILHTNTGIERVAKKLLPITQNFYSSKDVVLNTYFALGGKKEEYNTDYIKYVSFMSKRITAMAIARDKGVLEYI